MAHDLQNNKANAILRKAAKEKYGIAGVCVVGPHCQTLRDGLSADHFSV